MKIIYNWLASIQFVFIFAAFLITADVRGDIILGAPGVPIGMVVAPQVPFNLQYQLPSCYRFVFLGIQAKGNTLGSPGIKGTNDQFSLKASVRCNNSTPRERAGNLYALLGNKRDTLTEAGAGDGRLYARHRYSRPGYGRSQP